MLNRSIPSPSSAFFEIGPLTLYFYALCIICGIAVAILLGDRRLRAINPALKSVVADVAIFAVPFGIIGGRIYHVLSAPSDYFGSGSEILNIFAIWKGGLGIWGAISMGALGAYFGYRRAVQSHPELSFPPFIRFLDSLAPGVLLAQAIGRIGNWFNIELFGSPTQGWWALEVPVSSRPIEYKEFETFHPTFAYEALWCIFVAILLLILTRRLKQGQIFALYIALYCLGRFLIEDIRIDSANELLGLRQNQWVSVLIGLFALALFMRIQRKSSKI